MRYPPKIGDLEFFVVRDPNQKEPPARRWVLVRLTSDAGAEGWGEARLSWRPEQLGPYRALMLTDIAGRSIFDLEELLALECLDIPPLRCALEMASWDLIGRTLGQPIHRLIGGGYRQRIPLSVRLPQDSPGATVHLARELVDRGFHTQVLTASGEIEDDVRLVAAVAEVLADRAELRLDGRMQFDPSGARRLCSALEKRSLGFLLDPLREPTFHQLASLTRQTSVPLAASRTVRVPADVMLLARASAARRVILDFQAVGGLLAARKCAIVAEAAGLVASLTAGFSPGLTTAAMLQLAAATPALASANECAYQGLLQNLLFEPIEVIDGMAQVPPGPGLGVKIDLPKMESWQVTH